jgi:hypothetical protein
MCQKPHAQSIEIRHAKKSKMVHCIAIRIWHSEYEIAILLFLFPAKARPSDSDLLMDTKIDEVPTLDIFYGSDESDEETISEVPPDTESSESDDDFSDEFSDDCPEDLVNSNADDIYNELKWFQWKLDNNITDAAVKAFPSNKLPRYSTYRMKQWLNCHSGVTSNGYDCCIKSCMAYTGDDKDRVTCRCCNEPRYQNNGKPRKTFPYIPLIPRLATQYANSTRSRELRYRATYMSQKEEACANTDKTPPSYTYDDIFDGEHYQELLAKNLFADDRDVALGLSTDGFQVFKDNRHACWPILFTNYNIPPQHRQEKNNLLLGGIIPGPQQPKYIDTFLQPLIEELHQLQEGVDCIDALTNEKFKLRAHLLCISGDMPAISKVGGLRGTNSILTCRYCEIRGVRPMHGKCHYYPLRHPKDRKRQPGRLDLNPHQLLERTHANMVKIGQRLQSLEGKKKVELQKSTGKALPR